MRWCPIPFFGTLACHRPPQCVYGVLARFAFQGTTVRIGQRRIAKLLGIHLETVNKAIHELETAITYPSRVTARPGESTTCIHRFSARSSERGWKRWSTALVEYRDWLVRGRY